MKKLSAIQITQNELCKAYDNFLKKEIEKARKAK